MKLLETTVRSFMSFGEETTQEWDDIGLVLFEGQNNAAKSASSNGAGKTTLLESIPYGIYGQTTKGVGVEDVVNDKIKKNCMVRNIIGNPDTGEKWTITRYRKDNEFGNELHFKYTDAEGKITDLAGVDAKATQDRIDNFMGGSFTLFCNSVYFSQNNIKPFSLFTDKQMKTALVEALDLSRFFTALENVRLDLKTVRKEHDLVKGKKNRVEEEIEEARIRLENCETQEKEFDGKKKRGLADLQTRLEAQGTELKARKAMAAKREELLKQVEEKHKIVDASTASDDLKAVVEKVNPLSTNIKIIESKYNDITRQFTAKAKEAKNIKDRIGTDCGECGKTITKEDVSGVLKASVDTVVKLREKASQMAELMEKAKSAVGKYDEHIEGLNKEINAVNTTLDEIDTINAEIGRMEFAIDQIPVINKTIDGIKTEIERKAIEKSPFAPLIKKENDLIEEGLSKKSSLDALVKKKAIKIAELEYLETMFGYSGIPAFLLDMVVPFLNERANHYATMVCDGEIRIAFSTTSRTKTGKIREKFSIAVTHAKGGSNYKKISGGERKRADLCIAQAMQDLCRSYGKNPLDIVFYDEPFEHLDSAGVGGVVEMLSAIEKEIGSVAVVTHDEEMKSAFTKTITVIKDKDEFSHLAA